MVWSAYVCRGLGRVEETNLDAKKSINELTTSWIGLLGVICVEEESSMVGVSDATVLWGEVSVSQVPAEVKIVFIIILKGTLDSPRLWWEMVSTEYNEGYLSHAIRDLIGIGLHC